MQASLAPDESKFVANLRYRSKAARTRLYDHIMKSHGSVARLIAFYLPQFHPIPENDKWWGKGFTEWTVVANAKPLFNGHYQPRIPADLGFYDLRLPEIRHAQAEMAESHGIEGFCYWHYWLGHGRQLLEKPFNEVLRTNEPDFPFCLGWANHSWKGVFFGADGRTLIEQEYPGVDDNIKHFYYLLQAFSDDRYITVDGKPLLFVFAPDAIPGVKRLVNLWQEMAVKQGLKGIYFVGGNVTQEYAAEIGFDAVSPYRHRIVQRRWPSNKYLRKILHLQRSLLSLPAIYSYERAMQYFIQDDIYSESEIPAIVPNWDNSSRFGSKSVILHDSTPELFRVHVKDVLTRIAHKPYENRLAFIKSWNEWAEGNYMEPDLKYGRAYLQVIKDENKNSAMVNPDTFLNEYAENNYKN